MHFPLEPFHEMINKKHVRPGSTHRDFPVEIMRCNLQSKLQRFWHQPRNNFYYQKQDEGDTIQSCCVWILIGRLQTYAFTAVLQFLR